ncbi:MAG: hypothetical protein COV36_07195 [Alphaproteobacteria bacterium CG11_big_fil_rev_8_21_14_0_20_44_7]|nr:MAG: hypothetical protein COV36_07195 [Alphaproteobacteria bacterium CG11_big_fil_rev_8_21_14_0_20_44_7]
MGDSKMQLQTGIKTEASEATVEFKTRFGKVTYNPEKTISFPNGVLGMPNQNKFFIAKMPNEKMNKFQVMQSLVEDDVSFAVLPLEYLGENSLEQDDIDEIKNIMEITTDDLAIVLIASVQRSPSGTRLSVNLRAPVFIDVNRQHAYQIVLANNKYKVQHFLG